MPNQPTTTDRWTSQETAWMREALELATKGAGGAEPNPLVGCVLVKNNQVIGKGYHASYGSAHAEVEALRSLADQADARGSTAFVSLEPCSHFGKTPPCADALIAAKVSRVVIAQLDPFPQVDGRGLEKLQQAGIQVEVGLLEAEARELNAPYLKRLTTGLPWVIAKWAMSLDGKIATKTGESQWISCEQSRAEAHQVRGRLDAILVGSGTALADDPLLTARPPGNRVPRRVVFDSQARLPLTSRLVGSVEEAPVILVTTEQVAAAREAEFLKRGVSLWKFPGSEGERIAATLKRLAAEGATNVLVEGGPPLLGQFAAAEQIDELQIYVAPKIIGGDSSPGPIGAPGWSQLAACPTLRLVDQQQLGPDLKLVYRR
ncbi:MAG: bifunctional diaminohydroxyphosphoribosylaminopyrimidine deaminase/5-amino-6-(5-phosphoribosylamino)uracil reductase RibD [Planctomycetota bacterium]